MTTLYEWKPQGRRELPAQVAGERLESIRLAHAGRLIPADVVDDARPVESPLHPVFEWDDAKAAERWRQEEARELIRNVIVVSTSPDVEQKPIRAFVNISDSEGHNYTSISHAMSEPELRQQVLTQAWKELQGWHARYKEYEEFSKIFQGIQDTPPPQPKKNSSENANAVRAIASRFDSAQHQVA